LVRSSVCNLQINFNIIVVRHWSIYVYLLYCWKHRYIVFEDIVKLKMKWRLRKMLILFTIEFSHTAYIH